MTNEKKKKFAFVDATSRLFSVRFLKILKFACADTMQKLRTLSCSGPEV